MKFHPKLTALGRAALKDAVDRHGRGLSPVIALRYSKAAKSAKSKSGRRAGVDFVSLPGIGPDVHIGTLVSTDKGKLRIKDLARADGQELGNSYLSIDRIVRFAVLASSPASEGNSRRRRTPTIPTRERKLKPQS